MEINGYGYVELSVYKSDITLEEFRVPVPASTGEFTLSLHDGKRQHFSPVYFDFHSPSEHTVDGRHYDLELHLLHEYKGTNNMLGAIIAIFFNRPQGADGSAQSDPDAGESGLLKQMF